MTQRGRYWSCSQFANHVRGTTKPKALGMEEWDQWHEKAKSAHPWRYWIAEQALDKVQNVIWWPVDKLHGVKYRFANRFVTKSHALTSTLKKGEWHELDTRILHCMFNELVNYVEVELAWSNIAWDTEARKKYKAPFHAVGLFRMRVWRSEQAGLDHLKWAATLVDEQTNQPTSQASSAQQIIEMYNWWKYVRPQRKASEDASGWSDYCNSNRQGFSFAKQTPAERRKTQKMIKLMDKIDKQYHEEDTKMLVQLVQVRSHLWT